MIRSQPRAGEDGLLHRHLLVGALVEPAADRGVLALVVLAHDEQVDVAGRAAGQRRPDALEQPHRAQVDVLAGSSRRIGIRRPQSETWSGTPGKPTAPEEDRLEAARSWSSPSSGIIRPVLA